MVYNSFRPYPTSSGAYAICVIQNNQGNQQTLTKDALLTRCNDLCKFVVEALSEQHLRQLLLAMKVPTNDIKDLRSLKLLNHLLRLADLAEQSGLQFYHDAITRHTRVGEVQQLEPLARLFALTVLRQLADHRGGSDEPRKFANGLQSFRVEPAAHAAGWGTALDTIYDGVAATLEEAATTLQHVVT